MQVDKRVLIRISVSIALMLSLSHAAEADTGFNALSDMFTYSGFGTAGLAHSDNDKAEWVQNIQSVGSSDNFDYKTDSKLAVQGTVAPTQWLSGTAQSIVRVRVTSCPCRRISLISWKALPSGSPLGPPGKGK